MHDSIVLSSCLIGSYVLFSVSLSSINMAYIKNRIIPSQLMLLNGLTLGFSGTTIFYSVLYLSQWRSSRV